MMEANVLEARLPDFKDRIGDLFDADPDAEIDDGVIFVTYVAPGHCPQSTHDALADALTFEMAYEYCLSYEMWLDERIEDVCEVNRQLVADDVLTKRPCSHKHCKMRQLRWIKDLQLMLWPPTQTQPCQRFDQTLKRA